MRPRLLVLAALLLLTPSAVRASGTAGRSRRPKNAGDMVRLPAGSYRPLYVARVPETRRVAAFSLDRRAVTRGEFLAFVRRHAEWRRDRVSPALVEPSYLADWPGTLDAGGAEDRARPVTGTSWFAADAYCAAQGKRLPTLDEWEYAAAASDSRRDGAADPRYRARLLATYAARPATRFPAASSGTVNVYGVRGLHGSIWEWTGDSGPAAMAHHDHTAHSRAVPSTDRAGCASAALGAGDPSDYPAFLRAAVRAGLTPRTTLGTLGFRCAS
jgi:formylglycine-generating enzyme